MDFGVAARLVNVLVCYGTFVDAEDDVVSYRAVEETWLLGYEGDGAAVVV